MCLTVKAGETVRIATRNILVYKALIPRGKGKYKTCITRFEYHRGRVYTPAVIKIDRWGEVEAGFHTFVTPADADDWIGKSGGEIQVPMVIPKGSQYVLGKDGHVASSHIRFPKKGEKVKPFDEGMIPALPKSVKGKRVKAIRNIDGKIKAGAKGTIVEEGSNSPYVEWDNFNAGHDGPYDDGRKSCWSVSMRHLKFIK